VVSTRTPALSANDLKAELVVEATIGRDGRVSGTNVVHASGPLAIELRNAMRQIEANGSAQGGSRQAALGRHGDV
jgi:hypothetical protein